MDTPKISTYQKIHVWLNKKISLLSVKREKSKDYKTLEISILTFFLDGFIINLALLYFLPLNIINVISLGAGAFMIKRVFPSVIQLFNSINLIKVGR